MPSKKLIIVFGIILLALVAGALGALGTLFIVNYQTSKEEIVTSGPVTAPSGLETSTNDHERWQLYTNKLRGYQLRYPPKWTLTQVMDDGAVVFFQSDDFERRDWQVLAGASLYIAITEDVPFPPSAEEWYSNRPFVTRITSSTKTNIAGKQAIKFEAEGGDTKGPWKGVLIETREGVLEVRWLPSANLLDSPLFNEIIESLRLME